VPHRDDWQETIPPLIDKRPAAREFARICDSIGYAALLTDILPSDSKRLLCRDITSLP
jgi:hypothetical protein